MLRWPLRAIAWVALAGAFAAAVMDGARSIANGGLALAPLIWVWERIVPGKAASWEPALIAARYVPTSLALAVLGLAAMALATAGRR